MYTFTATPQYSAVTQHHHTHIWKCKLKTQAPHCMADLRRRLGPPSFRSGRYGSLGGHTDKVSSQNIKYQGNASLTLQNSERGRI